MNLINATTMFMLIKFISMQHNSKLLFKLANSILGRKQTSSYPDFTDDDLFIYLIHFPMTKSPILFHHYPNLYLCLSCLLNLIHYLPFVYLLMIN